MRRDTINNAVRTDVEPTRDAECQDYQQAGDQTGQRSHGNAAF